MPIGKNFDCLQKSGWVLKIRKKTTLLMFTTPTASKMYYYFFT